MGTVVLGITIALVSVRAQPFQQLLLPQTRHIQGVVIDSEGRPVAGARINHSNDRLEHKTDSEGRFELDTRAPALVVRKAGFRSRFLMTLDAAEPRLTLQKLREDQLFPPCANPAAYRGIEGWGASFLFPRTKRVIGGRQVQDADYGARSYYVRTNAGPKGIMHGSGPSWSFGIPSDRDVWRSVKYDEVVYNFEGMAIVDARGQFSDGGRWRYLGKFGESASYSGIDDATAKILDRFLDGACLKPERRH
jgi:hypothetical protein